MRKTKPKEIEAVLLLDGPQRVRHLVRRAADEEVLWALWDEGWAMMADGDGTPLFPLWPAKEYADLCAVEDWKSYEASEIELDEFFSELAPLLRKDSVRPALFPTPNGKGVVVEVDELCAFLRKELEAYD